MIRQHLLSIAALIVAVISGPAAARDDYVYGPPPDWARYMELAEPALREKIPQAKLGDPANWSVHWPNGYAKLGWSHKGRFDGYLTCGYLDQVAPSDGRYDRTMFAVVIDRDQVQTVDIANRDPRGLVNIICGDLVSRGILPPASLMGASTTPASAMPAPEPGMIVRLGLTIRPMREGAYVVAVLPGSIAERAGVMPGMVLARANDIPLADLGAAMMPLLGVHTATLALETVTGQRIDLHKTP